MRQNTRYDAVAAPKRPSKNRVGNKVRVRTKSGKTILRALPGFGEEKKPPPSGKKKGNVGAKLATIALLAGSATAAGAAAHKHSQMQKAKGESERMTAEKVGAEKAKSEAARAREEANKKRNATLLKVGAGVGAAGLTAYEAKKLYDKNTTIEPYNPERKALPPTYEPNWTASLWKNREPEGNVSPERTEHRKLSTTEPKGLLESRTSGKPINAKPVYESPDYQDFVKGVQGQYVSHQNYQRAKVEPYSTALERKINKSLANKRGQPPTTIDVAATPVTPKRKRGRPKKNK